MTPLYGLLESLHERVKGAWEERFERSYGFWRGLVDETVASYLACGLWQGGFARVRCRKCPEEFLVAFSCKRRGVCPSCGAKRAAELVALLQDEVVEEVGHALVEREEKGEEPRRSIDRAGPLQRSRVVAVAATHTQS
jgi:ribosomal protein S27E